MKCSTMTAAMLLGFLLGILGAARSALSFQIPNMQVRAGTLDLAIEPPITTEGSTLTIRGSTGVSAQAPAVRIEITPPTGVAHSFSARPDERGEFSLKFKQTQTAGTYQVHAQTGDGRGTAIGSFKVVDFATVSGDVNTELQNVLSSIRRIENDLQQVTTKGYVSAKARQFQSKLTQVTQEQDRLEKIFTNRERGVAPLLAATIHEIQVRPDELPLVVPLFDKLRGWSDQVRQGTERLANMRDGLNAHNRSGWPSGSDGEYGLLLASYSLNRVAMKRGADRWELTGARPPGFENLSAPEGPSICDAAQAATNSIDFLGVFAGFEDGLITLLGGFAAQTAGVPGCGIEAWNTYSSKGEGLSGSIVTVVVDLIKEFPKWEVSPSCEFTEAPFTATINANGFYREKLWWRYGVKIQGTLKLRWQKGQEENVTGEFEGLGTEFKVWENAVEVMDPTKAGFALHFHKLRATGFGPWSLAAPLPEIASHPGALADAACPFTYAGGSFMNALLNPSFFLIPVSGSFDENNILSLRLLGSTRDFDHINIKAEAHYLFLITAPLTVPQFIEFPLPYQNARFIIERALGNNSPGATDDVIFELNVHAPRTVRLSGPPVTPPCAVPKPGQKPGMIAPGCFLEFPEITDDGVLTFTNERSAPTGDPNLAGSAYYYMTLGPFKKD